VKAGIVGLGLIGGSLGRALRSKTEYEVFACDLSPDAMVKGELLGCYTKRLDCNTVKDVDLLIISVYPAAFEGCARELLPHVKAGATVIDCGGNKRIIAECMRRLAEEYPHINFVATHPMAGREFSGVEHSTAGLFENCSWLICPVSATLESISALKQTLYALGTRKIVHTTPEEHDKIIAYTSQLCHVVSSAFVKSPTASEGLGYTAGSFRDLTRVARLNPEMWTELFLQNADNLVEEIKSLEASLAEYRQAIENADKQALTDLLREGSERKLAVERSYRGFIRDEKDKG